VTERRLKNVSASVRQRLLNLAHATGEDFQHLLSRYAIERLLFRLSRSPYSRQFVLKGAVLFSVWSDLPHRTTRDVDFWSRGDNSVHTLEERFREISTTPVEDDGIVFMSETLQGSEIRTEDEYKGVRLRFLAEIAGARVPMQVDVGFGDDVQPRPRQVSFPTLLPFGQPKIRAYSREAVIAEKFQATMTLGMGNSRMKDFYDLYVLARDFEFRGETLCTAIRSTFERRTTPLPQDVPLALSQEFYEDRGKRTQWWAFLHKGRVADRELELSLVATLLRELLLPPAYAIARAQPFRDLWAPGGPWQPPHE
jgi:predicted nucleotidyltransferase component of viral defense system